MVRKKNRKKDMIKKKKYIGFMLPEALGAMALLGLLLILVARFEYYASKTATSLEQEYVATVAAETQFERLRAGLAVLDPKTFRQQYPGLDLEYRLRTAKAGGVVIVTTTEPEPRVLVRLVGPVQPAPTGVKK
jgi:hypothetical protein